jgi:DNA excision repair protein ERCC-1
MTAPSSTSNPTGNSSGSNGSDGAVTPNTENGGTAAAPAAPTGPVKPVHRNVSSKNAIVYNAVQVCIDTLWESIESLLSQRKNPVLSAIKNVPTEIGDIPADYQVGTHNGVLFLR